MWQRTGVGSRTLGKPPLNNQSEARALVTRRWVLPTWMWYLSSLWGECSPANIILAAWRDPAQRIQANHGKFVVTGYMSLENEHKNVIHFKSHPSFFFFFLQDTLVSSTKVKIASEENLCDFWLIFNKCRILLVSAAEIDGFSTAMSHPNLGATFECPLYAKFRVNFPENVPTFSK